MKGHGAEADQGEGAVIGDCSPSEAQPHSEAEAEQDATISDGDASSSSKEVDPAISASAMGKERELLREQRVSNMVAAEASKIAARFDRERTS